MLEDLNTFIVNRVAAAEKLFETRPEMQESKMKCDQLQAEVYAILEQSGQQELLRKLRSAQTEYEYWMLQSVYLQAVMDINDLFGHKH